MTIFGICLLRTKNILNLYDFTVESGSVAHRIMDDSIVRTFTIPYKLSWTH